MSENNNLQSEQIYYVKGMHCPSCELIIEKKLLEFGNIKSADAIVKKGILKVGYVRGKPEASELNEVFQKNNYQFSETPWQDNIKSKSAGVFLTLIIAAIFILLFILLNKLGLGGFININSQSTLPLIFLFGLVAGISSCAALVGGIILSMSKQWLDLYSTEASFVKKLTPHFLFNLGRLISYALLGAILGLIGSKLQLSLGFSAFLIIAVSIIMILLGLQMLGVKYFQRFQITAPKFITKSLSNEKKFQGKLMPFIMGATTFFLPCGFTLTAQGLALLSGNFVTGSLIMSAFALGTLPALLIIGLTSARLGANPNLSKKFLKVAGITVLSFALFNIKAQFNVLGFTVLPNISAKQNTKPITNDNNLAPIINGQQVIKMNASASGYSPNYFKLKANVPVRWEITDTGTSGCTNAVISKNLFSGAIQLTPGQTSYKEFTPQAPGKYKFSCWMGMVSGIIEVVN